MRRLLLPPVCLLIVAMTSSLGASSVRAQTKCLTQDEIKRVTNQVESNTTQPFNKKLNQQLTKLEDKTRGRIQNNVANNKSSETILKTLRAEREANTAELCSIIKQYGWPTRDLVGDD